MLRHLVDLNRRLSRAFDGLFPAALTTDGNSDFRDTVMPALLGEGLSVYDLGGGSRPWVAPATKAALGLTVTGLDLSADELAAAPEGSYDRAIAADLSAFEGSGDGDLVICQATLEHVRDTAGAMAGIASALRPGGLAAIFVPCRNAPFARLNLMLPEGLKRRLLFTLFPAKARGHDGFEAHYAHCTPRRLVALAGARGLELAELRIYWLSSYFSVFFPAYVLWRLWTVIARALIGAEMCETFVLVLRKPGRGGAAPAGAGGHAAMAPGKARIAKRGRLWQSRALST